MKCRNKLWVLTCFIGCFLCSICGCNDSKELFKGTVHSAEYPQTAKRETAMEDTAQQALSLKENGMLNDFVENYSTMEIPLNYESYGKLLGYGENDLYFLQYEDSQGYLVEVMRSTEDQLKESEVFCVLGQYDIVYFSKIIENNIYILTANTRGEKAFDISLWKIDPDGVKEEIYKNSSISAPIIYDIPGYIVLSIQKEIQMERVCTLETIHLATNLINEIDSTTYRTNEDGKGTGQYILYGGSLIDTGFYYEVVELNNEYLETAQKSSIYFYNFEDEIREFVVRPPRKSLFLTGDMEYLFCCEYEFEYPLDNSGVMYSLKEDTIESMPIPGIFTGGGDFLWLSKIRSGLYAGCNVESLIFMDMSKREICKFDLHKVVMMGNLKGVSNVVLTDQKLAYIVTDSEKGLLVQMEIY